MPQLVKLIPTLRAPASQDVAVNVMFQMARIISNYSDLKHRSSFNQRHKKLVDYSQLWKSVNEYRDFGHPGFRSKKC